MDSKEALERGFIDCIEEKSGTKGGASNRADALRRVKNWYDRQRARPAAQAHIGEVEKEDVGNTDGKPRVDARERRLRLMKLHGDWKGE